ncbi:hypothetical protein [Flavobacterium sp. '19STA2R22 D10 B1']|uniref:hypothetical protein n=1 Tax=Flavobacterium aerium TaxID=3037261 RepID=UPI00278C4AE7|nr:hypothetical protein [Flavobacterium sp. '19STA2R22 D10 B1']
MEQIEQIYFNEFGVSFYWKKGEETLSDRVQLVFKETGFYFSSEELDCFIDLIDASYYRMKCEGCNFRNSCGKFLLKTPFEHIDLAVSVKELTEIKDLVEGTLFQIRLDTYLNDICKN